MFELTDWTIIRRRLSINKLNKIYNSLWVDVRENVAMLVQPKNRNEYDTIWNKPIIS